MQPKQSPSSALRLAERLGLGTSLIHALGQLYERWDGKGLPHGLRGEAVSPAVLLVTLAQDAVTYQRLGDHDAAVQMVRARSGGAYDPRHADHFCARAAALMQGLDEEPSWELVLACEPSERLVLTEAQFDTACQALADFADIKSPYTLGHSPGVAYDTDWAMVWWFRDGKIVKFQIHYDTATERLAFQSLATREVVAG